MLHACPPSWPAISYTLARARPGDVIEIAGDYLQPEAGSVQPVKVRGTENAWIVIRLAAGKRMVGRADQQRPIVKPRKGDAFIKLRDSTFVRFEGLRIFNAWENAIDATNVTNVEFVDCEARGGRHIFRVRGESSAIRVVKCRWQQDERIWQKISWDEIHDGAFKHLNGALLRTDDIIGNVVFEKNEISDAYNGIKCRAAAASVGGARNSNFEIRDNTFKRIRDNPIEPEGFAYNWHIHHNKLMDCHGWFSLDGVRGGNWYVYANQAWFRSRQGESKTGARPDTHRRGFAFKMAHLPPEEMPGPVYVFNNSFHLRVPIFGNAQDVPPYSYSVKNWYFHDNAFEWRAEVVWAESGSKPEDEPVLGGIEPGIVFEQPFAFAGSLSNSISGWHGFVDRVGIGQSASNHYRQGRLFEDGAQGKFALRRGSPGRRSAAAFDLWIATRSTPWPMPPGRNIGAVQPPGFDRCWPPFEVG